jgi:hypothetical protein
MVVDFVKTVPPGQRERRHRTEVAITAKPRWDLDMAIPLSSTLDAGVAGGEISCGGYN